VRTGIIASLLIAGSVTAHTIRDVDFLNFTYTPSCRSDGTAVRVHNGVFYGHTNGGSDAYDFLDLVVDRVVYGHLTHDSEEQAVVVTRCNTGGTGDWCEALVYDMRQGRPALVTTLPGGDRADGGIASVLIKNGLLQVGYYGTSGGMCCPEWIDTATYRLVDRRLVEVGRRVRKALEGERGR